MKHKKIIFVCTGNTCRSPMAEAVMKQTLKQRKIRWYSVQSAGLRATLGSAMSVNSAVALTEAKIPFSEKFNSRQLTPKMVDEAYAVVCMTEAQRISFGGKPNVTSFYELCGVEIPDPYGQPLEVYRCTLQAIAACMPQVVKALRLEENQTGTDQGGTTS